MQFMRGAGGACPGFGGGQRGVGPGGGPAALQMLPAAGAAGVANWAFVDVFRWLSELCMGCLVAVWLLKKVKPGKAPEGAH